MVNWSLKKLEGGISSTNQELIQAERAEALQHLFPPQIIDSLNMEEFLELLKKIDINNTSLVILKK